MKRFIVTIGTIAEFKKEDKVLFKNPTKDLGYTTGLHEFRIPKELAPNFFKPGMFLFLKEIKDKKK